MVVELNDINSSRISQGNICFPILEREHIWARPSVFFWGPGLGLELFICLHRSLCQETFLVSSSGTLNVHA